MLWAVALLGATAIADRAFIADTLEAFGQRLRETAWAVPLAAAVVITVLTSQPVRRRWPHQILRLQVGIGVVASLWVLIAAVGPRETLLAVGLVALVGLLAAWVLVLPPRLAPPLSAETLESLEARDRLELTDGRLKLQNDLRTTALQAIGGLAVLAGAVLAFQQLTADRQQATATQELTRQGQASERFTRAIDQLGSNRPEVQLGGIYGLEQVAQQVPDNHRAVKQVLAAYLHRRSPRPANPTSQPAKDLHIRAPDVQAALSVLVRGFRLSFNEPRLDLSGLDLRGAEISGVFVGTSPFSYKAGILIDADLRGTDLRGTKFEGVYLSNANLRGADLRGADLRFIDTFLEFDDRRLGSDADIEQADFHGALADASTNWPDGFDWRAAGVKLR